MHGAQDDVVLPNQSQLLHQALHRAGVASRLHFLEGYGHGFGADPQRLDKILKQVEAFFDQHLKEVQ